MENEKSPKTRTIPVLPPAEVTTALPYKFSKYELSEDDPRRYMTLKLKDCVLPTFDSRLAPRPLLPEFLDSLSEEQHTPIHVCMLEDGTYLIIDGRGRYNGLKHNGATHIKAMLRPPPKDLSELLVFAIQANQHRENLKSYDFAMMIQKLSVDNSMSNKDIAKRLAVSEAYISQILSLFTLPPEIVKEWADGDYGESAQNKLRYMRKVKDVSIQFLLARTAKRVHLAALQRIIDAYLFAIDEGSGVDSRVIELILHGDLEPNSAERVKTLAKLKNSEQQFELAKILSKDTYTCIRKGETPPDIDTLNEWVSTAKRHSAGIVDDETDQEVETPSAKYTFKPLSASKVAETYATWTTKFKEARKDTDYEPAKLAELRGVLKGIKLAGGYSK